LSALIVFSVEDPSGKNLVWESKKVELKKISDATEWRTFSSTFSIDPALLSGENKFKLYIWNKAKEEFFVDDFELKAFGVE
jgi:hypothetical protein